MNNRNFCVAALLALSVVGAAAGFYIGYRGSAVPLSTLGLWSVIFSLLVAWWLSEDSKFNKSTPSGDWPFYLLILWPIIAPYYLVKSRGIEGIMVYVGLLACWAGPDVLNWYGYAYYD